MSYWTKIPYLNLNALFEHVSKYHGNWLNSRGTQHTIKTSLN